MKILIVDDHPLIRQALKEVLRELDPHVELVEAENGIEALELAVSTSGLNLILLDLTLPGRTGFEVLEDLRERHAEVPVVVLSATDARDAVMRALDAGAMGYIPKTSHNDALLAALRLVLAGVPYLPRSVLFDPATASAHSGHALERDTNHPTVEPSAIGLTHRQAEVLSRLVQGKPNKIICRELGLAEGTVKIHISAILKALNVHNRTQAVIAVTRRGIALHALS